MGCHGESAVETIRTPISPRHSPHHAAWYGRPLRARTSGPPRSAAGHHPQRPGPTQRPCPRPRTRSRRLPRETLRFRRTAGARPPCCDVAPPCLTGSKRRLILDCVRRRAIRGGYASSNSPPKGWHPRIHAQRGRPQTRAAIVGHVWDSDSTASPTSSTLHSPPTLQG